MSTHPITGDIGFYKPDPGSHHSPLVYLGLAKEDGCFRAHEVFTAMTLLFRNEDWMTIAELKAHADAVRCCPRYAPGGAMHDIREIVLGGYERAMRDAIDVRNRVVEIITSDALANATVPAPFEVPGD